MDRFSDNFFFWKEIWALNTGLYLRIILKHTYFFQFGWGDPSQLGSWSEGCVKPFKLSREAIWQVSEDPYHTEFVSWRVDYFLMFFHWGGVRRLVENSTNFFLNPSLMPFDFFLSKCFYSFRHQFRPQNITSRTCIITSGDLHYHFLDLHYCFWTCIVTSVTCTITSKIYIIASGPALFYHNLSV